MLIPLLSTPSISPDPIAENACAEKIAELISDGTSLQPEYWHTADGRKNVACLLKSAHPNNAGNTIILLSHFDTVGVQDYATLGDVALAFQPNALAEAIHTALTAKPTLSPSEQSALNDLQTAEWLFGRGSVDMKAGVALNITTIRHFADTQPDGSRLIDQYPGNIIFLSCPDEETESAGILAALPRLLQLRTEHHLTYLGVINTDYTAPRASDEAARYIYSGTVGKLLPSFYILGVRTHVGEPYRGVDASHIAAELVRHINLNPEWADRWEHNNQIELAPPPIALHMRDLKPSYNVETAGDAFVYINWLTLTLTPQQALDKIKSAALSTLEVVRTSQTESHRRFTTLGGETIPPPAWTPTVLNYAELYAQASTQWTATHPTTSLSEWLAAKTNEFASQAQDSRQLSCLIVAELARIAGLRGPAIVTFFSPPYYPSVAPQENAVAKATAWAAKQASAEIQMRGFYPYISDLSYLRLDAHIQIDALKNNMPLFEAKDNAGKLIYSLDEQTMQNIRALNCPVINIGPFGRDAHGLYERVHMPYTFDVLPNLIFQTIAKCFTIE